MKLKILESVRNDYPILGINLNQSIQKQSFNKQNLQSVFALGLSVASNFIYFFHVATTIDEFTISIFMSSSIAVVATVYAIVLSKVKSIMKLNNAIEILINESKFHHFSRHKLEWKWIFLPRISQSKFRANLLKSQFDGGKMV